MSVLLDTSVLIDVLRGRPATVRRLRSLRRGGEVPSTTAISVEEVHRGIRPAERLAATRLFDGLHVVAIGRAEGTVAGDWRRHYAAVGVTLAQADCLIAAAAVNMSLPLATGNLRHFPMPELELQHWSPGA